MLLTRSVLAASVLTLATGTPLAAQEIDVKGLEPVGAEAVRQIGSYRPQRLALTREKPATITVPPAATLASPLYGVLPLKPQKLDEGQQPPVFHIIIDEPAGGPAALYADSNGNGDFTDDDTALIEWKSRTYKDSAGEDRTQHAGHAHFQLRFGKHRVPARVKMYRFDPADPGRAQLKDVVLYYADYAYIGAMDYGQGPRSILLVDDFTRGDWAPRADENESGISLLVDVNRNGKFDSRGERYDVLKPFNLSGTTYEIKEFLQGGNHFKLATSQTTVPEILPPPDHAVGKPITAFNARTTTGQEIRFPESYKGKVVLLDFWATWCGPCVAELPHLTAAYEKFHKQGFEVLGISLDQENAAEKLAKFTREHNMPWPQVYDGKFWEAEIAMLYAVQSIPQAYLVDGDTGRILATGNSLRGEALGATIEKALAERKSGG